MCESEGVAWSEDESVSSGSHEGNVVIGYGLVTRSFFSWRIGSWQALSCRIALDMLCQGMNEAWLCLPRGLSRHECSPLTVDGP